VARSGSDGLPGVDFGGGIANESGTIQLKNTMLGYSLGGGNGAGVITDVGNNLSDDASFALTSATSRADSGELQLGNLSNQGGPTWSVPITSSNSPAVDAGDDATALPVDQRHFARSALSDIGAFEFGGVGPVALLKVRLETNQVVLSWTGAVSGYALQSTPTLSTPIWTSITNMPDSSNSQFTVTNIVSGSSRFYRLVK
jgi:hypothetical protein